jgi:hypothetical protein
MLSRKAPPSPPQPFQRVFPTRWMLEYCGVLPHCKKQGVEVVHYLQCRRVVHKPPLLPLEEGLSSVVPYTPTHELWCLLRVPKDRGDRRLLFRHYFDLANILGQDRQDWIVFKVTQHLSAKLVASTEFHHLIHCNTSKEYPWCANPDDVADYWSAEIRAKAKALIRLMER